MNPQLALGLVVVAVIVSVGLLQGFHLYRLMRKDTIRLRVLMPDGRSNTYLTRITRDRDIRVGNQSFAYKHEDLTYEGFLKVPTLEYLTPSRLPIHRRKLPTTDSNSLSPEAAYDGIKSHVMRELIMAFAEGVLSPAITLIVIVATVLLVGIGIYYTTHKDVKALQATTTAIYTLLTTTPTPTFTTPPILYPDTGRE